MNTYTNKAKESKSQSVSNANIQFKNSNEATFQFEDNRREAVAQQKLQEQPIQKKINKTRLPDTLKSGIENMSGYAMDDVKVHYNSNKPAQLNAHAYAQGTDIHVASGQEKHVPHEAWHVVQQKQGRVQSTTSFDGAQINDNEGLENEADVMGGKALQMKAKENKPTTNVVIPNSAIQLMQIPINRLKPMEEELLKSGDYSKTDLWSLSASEKIDAFTELIESDERKFLISYLIHHDFISLEEAELLDTPALVSIYEENIPEDKKTGLATEESTNIMAFRVELNTDNWQKASPLERKNILVIRANTELRVYGVPFVESDLKDLPGGEDASFSQTTWSINFNAETFNADSEGYEKMNIAEVANTVYHECRHAEQYYRTACLLAGDGLSFGEIQEKTNILPRVIKDAMKHPIRREHSGNLEVDEAITWEESFSGDKQKYREETLIAYKTTKLEAYKLLLKAEKINSIRLGNSFDYKNMRLKINRVKALSAELPKWRKSIKQWEIIDKLEITPQEKSERIMKFIPIEPLDEMEEAELNLELGLNEGFGDESIESLPYTTEDWANELQGLKDSLEMANTEFEELKKENEEAPFLETIKVIIATDKKMKSDILAVKAALEKEEVKRGLLHERYENLPEERDAFAVGNTLEKAIQKKTKNNVSSINIDSTIIQRKPVDGISIGKAELIRMKGKTIYGGDFFDHINAGDSIQIDDEKKYRSRRATVFSEEDKDQPHKNRWYKVLKLRGEAIADDIYFPANLFEEGSLSDASSDASVELNLHTEMILEGIGIEDVDELSDSFKDHINETVKNLDAKKMAIIASETSEIPEPLSGVLELLKNAVSTAVSNQSGFCQALLAFGLAVQEFKFPIEEKSGFLEETVAPIEEAEIDSIYQQIYVRIVATKAAAKKAGKPLLVLVGDQHYTKSSGFPQYLILDVIQRLGMSNVVLEITPGEAKYIAESMEAPPEEDMSERKEYLDAWFRQIVGGGSRIIPGELNKEEVVARLGTAISEKAIEERNEGISTALQTLGSDALIVVGASHLMGLMSDSAIREMYYLCVFNTLDPETMVVIDTIMRKEGKVRDSTKFLKESKDIVDNIILSGSVEHFSPKEMGDLARITGERKAK